jgi:hypothetical protein
MITLIDCFKTSPRFSLKQTNFFDIYETLFQPYRDREIVLVEIGIFQGGSLFMWRNYFGAKARIIGIEANPDAVELRSQGFEIHIGDQSNPTFWKKFFQEIGPIDILIDDGGHWNEQQIKTVAYCAEYIRDGGILIIEDTQTSYYDWMGNPSRYSFVEYTKYLIDVINARNTQIKNLRSHQPLGGLIYCIRAFNSVVAFDIDRSKCTASKPIDNGAPAIGRGAVGTEHSDYGATVAKLRRNPLIAGLREHCGGLLKPASRFVNKMLLARNNRKLRRFFQ